MSLLATYAKQVSRVARPLTTAATRAAVVRSSNSLLSSSSSSSSLSTSSLTSSSVRSFSHSTTLRTPDAASASTSPASGDVIDGASLFGSGFSHLSLTYSSSLQCLTVKMSRPELHNAFNEVLIREISTLFRTLESACSTDPTSPLGSLRAVVLTGAGASFSAGADLNWMKKMRTYTEAENLADSKQLFTMFLLLSRCPVPLIARVNGSALGGGVGLVAACDIAIAAKGAQFGLTEVKLGLSPAVISSFVMAKLSPSATNLYFLTGSRFGAPEAQQHGLVAQVVEDEAALDAAVQKIVEELALNSPKAVRATKSLISRIRSDPRIPEAEAYCTSLISKLRVSTEGQEGLNAFFEKRKAQWIPAHLGNPKPKKK